MKEEMEIVDSKIDESCDEINYGDRIKVVRDERASKRMWGSYLFYDHY